MMDTTTNQFRKISSNADSRMRSRTAKEQLEAVLRELERKETDSVPAADDESTTRTGVLS